MERRRFLKVCGLSCVGAFSISLLATGCSGVKYIYANAENDILKIDTANFIEKDDEKNTVTYLKSIIVKPNISDFPIVIYRNSESDYTALLLRCTHQGNELNVYGELLTCSAHGSEFDKKGQVLQGPAEESLIRFPVDLKNNFLYINLA